MGMWLLWIAQASFALLAGAAGTALLASTPRTTGAWIVALLAVLPLLALHLLLTWSVAELRFGQGVEHAPWLFAASLFALHGLGVVWLLRRGVSGATLFGWSAGRLAVGALVAGGFSFAILRVLNLEARLTLSKVRAEASAIVFELAPAAPSAELNAAPVYERAGQELFGGEDFVELDDYDDALSNRAPLEADRAELRRLLERCAPALDRVRAASALPYCHFAPKDGRELVRVPSVMPRFSLARLLCLEARVRAHQGNLAGAVDDVLAALRMSEHVARMPTLLALAVGTAMRTETLGTLLHVASLDGVGADELARLGEPLGVDFATLAPAATRWEEAHGLALLEAALVDGDTEFAGFIDGGYEWIGARLYAPFLLEGDLRGYREVMAELLALSRLTHRELASATADDRIGESVRRRGILASLMAPNMTRVLDHTHQGDAQTALARLALAAARERLAHGSYPTNFGPWSGSTEGVRIEGDGSAIRLLRTDPSGADVEVSLPPRPPR